MRNKLKDEIRALRSEVRELMTEPPKNKCVICSIEFIREDKVISSSGYNGGLWVHAEHIVADPRVEAATVAQYQQPGPQMPQG